MGLRKTEATGPGPTAGPGFRLTVDGPRFHRHYGKESFRIEHDLAGHPLFSLERLSELAGSLPAHRVEWNVGNLPVVHDPERAPSNGLSAPETILRAAECDSWIVLKHVQLDAEYGALLEECLAAFVRPLAEQGLSLLKPCGFIFVSSPGAVTPCHLDPESNFLLQVAGSKTLSTFPKDGPQMVDSEALEAFTAGGHRNMALGPAQLESAQSFLLRPGEGLHVPLHAPHFVRNGPEVSVSFSVTFQTELTDRERGVLWMNHRLRQLGIRPRPPGASEASDRAKTALFCGLRRVRRLLRD